MPDKKNAPEIRFKGFLEPWEDFNLNSLVSFYSGLTYSPQNVAQEGTLVLRSSNVKNDEIIDADNVYVKNTIVNCENVKKGDIIVVVRNGSRALIGKHAQIKKDMPNTVIGAFMTGVRYSQSEFLNALLSTVHFSKEIEKNLGATINQITTGAFKEMSFLFPKNNNEQQKIGKFFSKIDDLIKFQQQKLEKLKNIKKSMQDKMFPKNGNSIPEIRFKGFLEPWKKSKLGNIYSFKYGEYNNNPSNGGIYPVFGANGIIGGFDKFNAKNSVIIGHMGEYAGSVLWGEGKHFVTYNGTISLPNQKVINDKFGYFMLFQLNLAQICGGSGMPFLSYEQLQRFDCTFPQDKKEQQKIGKFFSKIDDLIKFQQQKLEKLKNIKKSMLDKMFV